MFESIFWAIGLLATVRLFIRLYPILIEQISTVDMDKYGKGSWALVTGGTDGIGLGYVRWLARKGLNVVVFGRNAEKLSAVKEDVEKKYKVLVKTVVKDFSDCCTKGFFEDIEEEIQGLDVSVLVNNVGVHGPESMIAKSTNEKVKTLVSINCIPQAVLMNMLAERLNTRKQRSAIVDISSITAIRCNNYMPVYNASKAFNMYLTMGTGLSKSLPNIDLLSVLPGYVLTNLGSIPDTVLTSNVDECVEGSMRGLGKVMYTYGSGKSTIHGLFFEFFHLFPWKICFVLRRTFTITLLTFLKKSKTQ